MPLNLVKLAVGASSVQSMRAWQEGVVARRLAQGLSAVAVHETRQTPQRKDEILDGGSLFWVVKGVISVRQRIREFEPVIDGEGRDVCRIHLDQLLVETEPRPMRPFQGWRYLDAAAAPPDVGVHPRGLPASMETALKQALVW